MNYEQAATGPGIVLPSIGMAIPSSTNTVIPSPTEGFGKPIHHSDHMTKGEEEHQGSINSSNY